MPSGQGPPNTTYVQVTLRGLQGCLAHKKMPPPPCLRAIGMSLLEGPRGRRYLMSEIPLYAWEIRSQLRTVRVRVRE